MASKGESINQFKEGSNLKQVPPALSQKRNRVEKRKTGEEIKKQVLPENILLERAEHLKVLNETLSKEVGSDFRCILNKKGYFNIMYKGDNLKIDIKQEDGIINLAKHINEILSFIKKEGLEGNKSFSRTRIIKNVRPGVEEYLSIYDIYIEKYIGISKELITDSEKILINSGYSKRPGLREINGRISGNGEMNGLELARKNEIATDLFVDFLNKINK